MMIDCDKVAAVYIYMKKGLKLGCESKLSHRS